MPSKYSIFKACGQSVSSSSRTLRRGPPTPHASISVFPLTVSLAPSSPMTASLYRPGFGRLEPTRPTDGELVGRKAHGRRVETPREIDLGIDPFRHLALEVLSLEQFCAKPAIRWRRDRLLDRLGYRFGSRFPRNAGVGLCRGPSVRRQPDSARRCPPRRPPRRSRPERARGSLPAVRRERSRPLRCYGERPQPRRAPWRLPESPPTPPG